MGLEIGRSTAEWGVINIREEGRGEGGKVEAHDIPFTIHGGIDLLDQVVEYDVKGKKPSDVFFDPSDGRVLLIGADIKPSHRKEGLTITVWDKGPNQKDPLVLKEARIQAPEIKLASPNQVAFKSKIQIVEPTDEVVNRFRHLRGEHCEIQIVAEQAELFKDKSEK